MKTKWLLLIPSFFLHCLLGAQTRAVNAFYYASEIVIDSRGNLFVGGKNNKIIKISPDGHTYHFAGHPKGYSQSKDGKGAEAMFARITGLAIDEKDNLYISDYTAIRKLTPDGILTTLYGNPNVGTIKDGSKHLASFHRVGAIALDKKGTIYVSDEATDSVKKRYHIIRKIPPDGNVRTIRNEDGSMFKLNSIGGLACDDAGNLYVSAMAWSSAIMKITPDESISIVAGTYDENVKKRAYYKESDPRPISPAGLAVSPKGELYFSDRNLQRILKISGNRVIEVAGGGNKSANGANLMTGGATGGYADGKGKQALLNGPAGLAFDKSGNLYFLDGSSGNNYIRKLSQDGIVSTYSRQVYNPDTKQYEDDNAIAGRPGKTITVPGKDEVTIAEPDLKVIRKIAERYADSMLRVDGNLSGFLNPMSALVQQPQPDTFFQVKLPPRNERWLGAMPAKKLSATELKKYIDQIEIKFTAHLRNNGIKLPDITNLDAGSISYSSSLLLVKGLSDQAAWMAIKAVQKAPGNILVLNNSGAVLNACGFQPVSVPVLETALETAPANSNIQNNLGQAYIALGETQKATILLQQSVNGNPYHPHANLSLAYLYYAKGDKGNALKHTENSLRGSFTDRAVHLLFKLKPDARIMHYLKDRYKPTDYFNQDKYHLPQQCENVSQIAPLKGEYSAFREMVKKLKNKFEALSKEQYQEGSKSMQARVANYKNSTIMRTPFTQLGYMMLWDRVYMRLHDEKDKLSREQHIYRKSIDELTDSYNEARKNAEGCEELIAVANRYMELMATVTREYQKAWLPIWKEISNDGAFWSAVAYPDRHLQRATYASSVSTFLGEVLRLAETHFLEPGSIDCAETNEKKKTADELKIMDMHCPIDIGVEFGIGSFSVDCEKIEYHFGGILVADVVHSIRNHSTTIAIGAGLDLKFGGEKLKAGPIQGGFNVKGKMQYFLTFDGTHPSDQGIIWETGIKYKQKLKTGIEGFEKLEEIQTNQVNISANTILSVHNGWTFDGSLYQFLDKILEVKPEKPQNKNIKIYNPQQ
jgi:tetratricopeptide (TPR) repeat protein